MIKPAHQAVLGLAILLALTAGISASLGRGPETSIVARVEVKLNTEEAEAVLAILDQTASGGAVDPALWTHLFSTEPYIRLKKREAEIAVMFNVPELKFGDEDFKKFVLSGELRKRAPDLKRTLDDWKKTDLAKSGTRILTYLPAEARIRVKVYPVIKPQRNSFVYEASTDPAIFLYLNPEMSEAQFENTVAHEMHHIGLSSVDALAAKVVGDLPPRIKTASQWLGAFGEGMAMLAAAGGPDVHPHATSDAKTRARWDQDMAKFNSDLKDVERFFMDILEGRLQTEKEVSDRGSTFFGTQGPWYTVGYKMAVMVEKGFGRPRLIQDMIDFRGLLVDYNAAAEKHNRDHEDDALVLWSPELLKALQVGANGSGK